MNRGKEVTTAKKKKKEEMGLDWKTLGGVEDCVK